MLIACDGGIMLRLIAMYIRLSENIYESWLKVLLFPLSVWELRDDADFK